jgi:aminoglycoside/choline kinase family phosphotransferase
MLAAFHQEPLPDVLPLAPHLDYTVPPFDNEAMMIEVGLMPEWYLPDKA